MWLRWKDGKGKDDDVRTVGEMITGYVVEVEGWKRERGRRPQHWGEEIGCVVEVEGWNWERERRPQHWGEENRICG